MKRTPLRRKTPLRRSGFKRKKFYRWKHHKPKESPVEIAYREWVRTQPCIAHRNRNEKQTTRTTPHHRRHGMGMGQKAPHWDTIPLCDNCHYEFHNNRSEFIRKNGDEMDLLRQFQAEAETGALRRAAETGKI